MLLTIFFYYIIFSKNVKSIYYILMSFLFINTHTHAHTHAHAHTHMRIYIYIYIYIHVCERIFSPSLHYSLEKIQYKDQYCEILINHLFYVSVYLKIYFIYVMQSWIFSITLDSLETMCVCVCVCVYVRACVRVCVLMNRKLISI